jgi:hypothetical protein
MISVHANATEHEPFPPFHPSQSLQIAK